MATPTLARKQASVYLREDLHAQVVNLAESEGRTFSQMVERLLLQHPALAEREVPGRVIKVDGAGNGSPGSTEGSSPPHPSSRSASAGSNDAAGTNGKGTAAKAGAGPSPPSGKPQPTTCSRERFHRKGTLCKECGFS